MNDVYQTPDSNLVDSENIPMQPVKAVIVGLLLTFVGMSIVSSALAFAAASILGVSILSEPSSLKLVSNYPYLILDTIISILYLFWCGKFLTRYVPGQESKYGIIVALLTSSIYIASSLAFIEFIQGYPAWYFPVSLILTPLAIFFGFKCGVK